MNILLNFPWCSLRHPDIIDYAYYVLFDNCAQESIFSPWPREAKNILWFLAPSDLIPGLSQFLLWGHSILLQRGAHVKFHLICSVSLLGVMGAVKMDVWVCLSFLPLSLSSIISPFLPLFIPTFYSESLFSTLSSFLLLQISKITLITSFPLLGCRSSCSASSRIIRLPKTRASAPDSTSVSKQFWTKLRSRLSRKR